MISTQPNMAGFDFFGIKVYGYTILYISYTDIHSVHVGHEGVYTRGYMHIPREGRVSLYTVVVWLTILHSLY